LTGGGLLLRVNAPAVESHTGGPVLLVNGAAIQTTVTA
jgi:hypothetical protein